MHFFRDKIKLNKQGLIILLFAFIISSNIAWLNPAPEKESYQPNPKIPIFWQYNYDAGIEILTAAYFPKIFYKDDTRIDRPTYPVLANLIGKFSCLFICPFYSLSELEKGGIGYIILKLLIYIFALCLINEILIKHLKNDGIILSNFLIFFSIISIGNIAVFHTIELQFITPIFILFLFLNIINKYNIQKNFLFSFIVGLLMLAKPNYAVYLSILIFSMINKKYLEAILSIIFHLIPFFLYLFFLKYLSLEYRFVGADSGQANWFIPILKNLEIINFLSKFAYSIFTFCLLLVDNYKFWLIFTIIGFFSLKKKINNNFFIFFYIFIFFTWLQIFISFRHKTYMTSDIMIFIYPLAALGFYNTIEIIKFNKFKKFITISIVILMSLTNIGAYTNFPLIHPYDQPAKNSYKMKKKLNYLIN